MWIDSQVFLSTPGSTSLLLWHHAGGLWQASFLALLVRLQVRSEVLHEGDLLVKFLGVVGDLVHLHDVLLLADGDGLPLVVVEGALVGLVQEDLGRVVEEDARRSVREQVAQAVLRGVVHPLLHPALRRGVGRVLVGA